MPPTVAGNAALQAARSKRKVMKCPTARCDESKAVFVHGVFVKCDDEEHHVADLIASDAPFVGKTKSS